MKPHRHSSLLSLALLAALTLPTTGQLMAQTYTNLHGFNSSGGANPQGKLLLSGDTLYGTASEGGTAGMGTVFKVNRDGTGFATLHTFSVATGTYPYYTNTDGANPVAGLTLSGSTLYGTAKSGGTGARGTIFALSTNGTGFRTVYSFMNPSDGSSPEGALTIAGNTLYGTCGDGGSWGYYGTVFSINTNGTGFTTLRSFNYNDGGNPYSELTMSGNTLYGTTWNGGLNGNGIVFSIRTNGTAFTTLHTFTEAIGSPATNSDGAGPIGGLCLSGSTLYGTASAGGNAGNGTLFKVNINGTGFATIRSFTPRTGSYPYANNADGAYPTAGLILSGSTLYGTAYLGGMLGSGFGTIYAVNTDGTAFTTLHHFGYDAPAPRAGMLLSGNSLYGTATGAGGWGAVFRLSVPPPALAITRSGPNVVLSWPTYAPGVTLQCTSNVVASAAWESALPAPSLVSGQYAVTNPASGTRQFYRLRTGTAP